MTLSRIPPTLCAILFASLLGTSLAPAEEVSRERLERHVTFLARDELAGRDSGEPGLEVAAEYLAREFQNLGLEPAGDNGSYFDYFTVPYGAEFAGKPGVTVTLRGAEQRWEPWSDAFPLGFGEGAPQIVEAPVVFAGFGISASEEERKNGLDYDDYDGVDVKGKIVVVLRFVPRSGKDGDRFGGRRSEHASFVAKLTRARKAGAAGVVFVTPPGSDQTGRELESIENLHGFALQATPRFPTLPALVISAQHASTLLAAAGENLDTLVREIETEFAPRSRALDGVSMKFGTQRGWALLRNVVARLPGAGNLADESIVIGGHYDHIGRYGSQVARKHFGHVHNGADDNASGTAGIVELAQVFSQSDRPEHARSLVFLCFSGEEIGLLGSRHWVDAPRRFRLTKESALVGTGHGGHGGAPHGEASGRTDDVEAVGGVALPAGTLVQATGAHHAGHVEVIHARSKRTGYVPRAALKQVAGPTALDRIALMVNLDMIGRSKNGESVSVIGANSSKGFAELLDEKSGDDLKVKLGGGLGGGGSDHANFLRQSIPVLFFFTGMHSQYNTPDDDVETIEFGGLTKIVRLVRDCVGELRSAPTRPVFDAAAMASTRSPHGADNKPKLGVRIEAIESGVRVVEIITKSPAEAAGLRVGDVLRTFSGEPIRALQDLLSAIGEVEAGSEHTVVVDREGEAVELVAKFPGRGGFRVSFGSVPDYAFDERGVRFEDIRADSSAAKAGVKPGDVLVTWAGKDIQDVAHWTGFLTRHKPGDEVVIEVKRGDETIELKVTLQSR